MNAPEPASLAQRLKAAGVTYDQVARHSGVSWRMVKYVIDGQRTSAKVMQAIEQLESAARATRAAEEAKGSSSRNPSGTARPNILPEIAAANEPSMNKLDALQRRLERLEAEFGKVCQPWTWTRARQALRRIHKASNPLLWRLVIQALAIGERQAERARETEARARPHRATPDRITAEAEAWLRRQLEGLGTEEPR